MSSLALNTILGTAGFGEWPGMPTVNDPAIFQQFLDFCKKNGINQLDTARGYGTSEEFIGNNKATDQGFLIDTKVVSFFDGAHTPDKIRDSMKKSLENLKLKKVHILYLHAPDKATPFEDTLKAINDLYKEGTFEKFGLSNYSTEQVKQILKISREKKYVLPTVYQGNYNAITRKNEDTLFPLLKKEGISFYAYSPVAAGFFTLKKDQSYEGGRYDKSNFIGNLYQNLYFKDSYFKALEKFTTVSQKYGLNNIEVAIRWIYFHSQLKKENGDSVIFGPSVRSGLPQLESNITAAKQGPLPDEVVKVLEEIWVDIKSDAPNYYF